jgi:hypothetical protein
MLDIQRVVLNFTGICLIYGLFANNERPERTAHIDPGIAEPDMSMAGSLTLIEIASSVSSYKDNAAVSGNGGST